MIHIGPKLITAAVIFAVVFSVLVYLFIKKPGICKCKNKFVRGLIITAIAIVPGVCAATVAAKTITVIYNRFSGTATEEICEAEAVGEEEEKGIDN